MFRVAGAARTIDPIERNHYAVRDLDATSQ